MANETRSARLPLEAMHERHAGLTREISDCYHQAASVCLDRHHTPPVLFVLVDGEEESEAEVQWFPTTEAARRAWANEVDATEFGAYACALAATELTRGLVAVHRAETGTGADYYIGYIGPRGSGANDLEECLRLEVSGVDSGDAAALRHRLAAKARQVREGTGNLPAMAGVVGFKARRVLLTEVQAKQ